MIAWPARIGSESCAGEARGDLEGCYCFSEAPPVDDMVSLARWRSQPRSERRVRQVEGKFSVLPRCVFHHCLANSVDGVCEF